MRVTFITTNSDGIRDSADQARTQEFVESVLRLTRPLHEDWIVTAHGRTGSIGITFDFARGTEAAKSVTIPDGRPTWFRILSRFLRTEWPDGLQPTRELLFSFPSVGRLVECDLRFHGDAWGWEAQIFIDDEFFSRSMRLKTRAAALQWAEQERKGLSAATSTSPSVIRQWLTHLRGLRR